ncbi:RDD family protein [Nonomuraea sp. FMUSA5-5]|uniref:RDD family protein n=1 Tax=Nonomuraea composti TaxID=2720023 RepID=A0ABX1B1Q9_9ACTN|nr:RDD family protein [Nonomuraea sp. FMUSA5-5]NJP89731.1 RDD family protein [Nonomuraea sp. FMUSA5-5]
MGLPPPGLAGRWRRLFAGVLDLLIVNVAVGPFTWTSWSPVWDGSRDGTQPYPVEHTFVAGLVAFLYFWLLHAFWNGQTLGKKLFGLRVVSEFGGRIGVGQAAVRQAVFTALGWLCCVGSLVDLGWILFDPRKQAVHDKAARTVVVNA